MQISAYFGRGDACIIDETFCVQTVADADETIRIVEGQRAQQDAFDEREDGGGGADAEGEREHDRERETGSAAQLAQCEAQVQHPNVHVDLLGAIRH